MSRLSIRTHEKRFPVAPDLYGLFFEDISHAGDGGLYPEMLRNRSFEDSLMPEGCVSHDGGKTFVSPTGWIDEFNNGEGMNQWVADNRVQPTPVPAWYCEGAEMTRMLPQRRILRNCAGERKRIPFLCVCTDRGRGSPVHQHPGKGTHSFRRGNNPPPGRLDPV